jgi:cytochrome c-type biogenesis protein
MQVPSLESISILTYVSVFFFGIITSFTPCIYPIIPIVLGYLGSRNDTFTGKVIASIAYVLGLSLVYTLLGMVAALTGRMFGSLTTNTYVYLCFGIIILILGGGMMDFYQIPLPGFSSSAGESDKKSVFIGPFILGLTSGLVASPCTAPVLGTLLVYVAAKKAVVSGGLLLFSFSLGMSIILLVLGLSTGLTKFLPKSGNWMVVVKKVLALLLIAAGVYFIYAAGKLA